MGDSLTTYNYFGRGMEGLWVPPSEARGNFLRLQNARIDSEANGVYLREGSETLVNSTVSATACYAFGHVSIHTPANSIPQRFDLLAQVDTSVRYYNTQTDTFNVLAADTGIMGTHSFSEDTIGQIHTGFGDRTYLINGTPTVILNATPTVYYKLGTEAANPNWTASGTVAAAGATTTGYYYAVTYEHLTTGYHSDYTDLSPLVQISAGNINRYQFDLGGTDYITRLWRTTDGGSVLYLEATYSGGTGTRFNTTATPLTDAQLVLQEIGSSIGVRAAPPSTANVSCIHNNRLFIASDNLIYISDQYNGSDINLGYFAVNNIKEIDQVITAMYSYDNQLFIFSLDNMYVMRGSTLDEYRLEKKANIGCLTPTAVAANSNQLTWVSQEGIHSLSNSCELISQPVDDLIQPVLRAAGTRFLNIKAWWQPHTRQFIYSLVNLTGAFFNWEDQADASAVNWEDQILGTSVSWQDEDIVLTSGSTIDTAMVAWHPYSEGIWSEYRYAQIYGVTSVFQGATHPHSSSDIGAYQQKHDYIIHGNRTTVSIIKTYTDSITDSGQSIFGTAIVGPLIPGTQVLRPKFVRSISFGSAYRKANMQLSYVRNIDNVTGEFSFTGVVPWIPLTLTTLRTNLPLNTMNWLHLAFSRLRTVTGPVLLLRDFTLHYRERAFRAYDTLTNDVPMA